MAKSQKDLNRDRLAYARTYAGRSYRLGPRLPIIKKLTGNSGLLKMAILTKRQLGDKPVPPRLLAEIQRQLLHPPAEDAFPDGT